MKVELLQEWLGHSAGAVLDLRDNIAAQMIEREVAKEVKDKQLKKSVADKMVKETSTK